MPSSVGQDKITGKMMCSSGNTVDRRAPA
jgi:hypothetical protein